MENSTSPIDLKSHFKDLPDEDWKQLVIRSIKEEVIDGVRFPKYTHLARLGSRSAESGVEEAFRLYQLCQPFLSELLNNRKDCSYMDFGCGAGRIFRMFLKNFDRSRAIGVDCNEELIKICQADFDGFRFETIPERPPIKLPSSSIDVITAYSVFSHFSAIQNTRWVDEFARLLRPGGLAFLTTYGRGHLEYLQSTPEETLPAGHLAQKRTIEGVGGFSEIERMFQIGEMMYFLTNKSYDYGWAFVGPEYARRAFGRHFELLDFLDDYQKLEQAVMVLRKKEDH
jgi:SAM-dependent methyltransferase